MEKELSEEELEERIAILKRFRHLLEQQRQKFRDYLNMLENQATVIENNDTEALVAHTELEQQIVENISSLQKVITPMEDLYTQVNSRGGIPGESTGDIPVLKTDLVHLQQQVLEQNKKNCELLKSHMTAIRTKIQGLKNPYKNRKSIYSGQDSTATIINIDG